jgi:hypothetical protein
MIIDNSQNVGIGTTSPGSAFKLDVNGYIKANSRVYVRDSTKTVEIGTDYIQSYVTSGTGVNPIRFFTGSTEKARVDGNGNVGIGTTSPGARLHIKETTSSDAIVKISPNVGAADPVIQFTSQSDDIGTEGFEIWYDNSVGAAHLSTTYNNNAASIQFHTKTQASKSTSNERMRITGDGNVGIGTTSPGAVLTVGEQSTGTSGSGVAQDNSIVSRVGAANAAGRVTGLTIANTATATVGNDATLSFIVAGNYSATGLISTVLSSTSTAGTDMVFSLYNDSMAEKMRITSTGNVGIGTTSPAAKLHVNGNVLIGTNGADETDNPPANFADLHIHTLASGTPIAQDDAASLVISTGANNTGVQGWNGTLWFGNSDYPAAGNLNNSTGSQFNYKLAGIGSYASTDTGSSNTGSGDLRFFTTSDTSSPSEKMIITRGGNVGIGTTDPGNLLHIQSASSGFLGTYDSRYLSIIEAAGEAYYATYVPDNSFSGIRFNNTSGLRAYIDYYHGTQGEYMLFSSQDSHRFAIGTSEKLRITSTGNVGIGTTSPSYKLTVSSGTDDIGILTASSDSGSYVGFLDNATSTIPKIGAVGNKLILDASQYVGIKRTDPSYALDVSGTIRATGDVIAYSDARVKENVETIPNALDKVKAMRGVGYNKIGEQKRSIGVIAQEMLEVMPEVVSQDEQGMYSVAYGNLVGVLVEAMKEQQKQIDELKAQLDGITK